jgi:hypothetical protein
MVLLRLTVSQVNEGLMQECHYIPWEHFPSKRQFCFSPTLNCSFQLGLALLFPSIMLPSTI